MAPSSSEGKSFDYKGYCKAKRERNKEVLDSLNIKPLKSPCKSVTPRKEKRKNWRDLLKELPPRKKSARARATITAVDIVAPKTSVSSSEAPNTNSSRSKLSKPLRKADADDNNPIEIDSDSSDSGNNTSVKSHKNDDDDASADSVEKITTADTDTVNSTLDANVNTHTDVNADSDADTDEDTNSGADADDESDDDDDSLDDDDSDDDDDSEDDNNIDDDADTDDIHGHMINKQVLITGGNYLGKTGKPISFTKKKVIIMIKNVGKVKIIPQNMRLEGGRMEMSKESIGHGVVILRGKYFRKRGRIEKVFGPTAMKAGIRINGIGYRTMNRNILAPYDFKIKQKATDAAGRGEGKLERNLKMNREGSIGKRVRITDGLYVDQIGIVNKVLPITAGVIIESVGYKTLKWDFLTPHQPVNDKDDVNVDGGESDGMKKDEVKVEIKKNRVENETNKARSGKKSICQNNQVTTDQESKKKEGVENKILGVISPEIKNYIREKRSRVDEGVVYKADTLKTKKDTIYPGKKYPSALVLNKYADEESLKVGMYVNIKQGPLKRYSGFIVTMDQEWVVLRFKKDTGLLRVNKWNVKEIYDY